MTTPMRWYDQFARTAIFMFFFFFWYGVDQFHHQIHANQIGGQRMYQILLLNNFIGSMHNNLKQNLTDTVQTRLTHYLWFHIIFPWRRFVATKSVISCGNSCLLFYLLHLMLGVTVPACSAHLLHLGRFRDFFFFLIKVNLVSCWGSDRRASPDSLTIFLQQNSSL